MNALPDTFPPAEGNDPFRAGAVASPVVRFGPDDRFATYAVHTRFDAVSWFTVDTADACPVTWLPRVIRQEPTPELAVAGLEDRPRALTACFR